MYWSLQLVLGLLFTNYFFIYWGIGCLLSPTYVMSNNLKTFCLTVAHEQKKAKLGSWCLLMLIDLVFYWRGWRKYWRGLGKMVYLHFLSQRWFEIQMSDLLFRKILMSDHESWEQRNSNGIGLADNTATYMTSEKGGLLCKMFLTVLGMDCFISSLEMHQQRLKCLWLIL